MDEKTLPWYFRTSSLVVVFLCAGPLVLPLVWFHPGMSRQVKAAWTMAIAAASVLLIKLTVDSLRSVFDLYNQLSLPQ